MKKLQLMLLAAFILSVYSCGNPETDTLTPDVTETTDESVSSAESELFTLPKENNNGEKINILLGSHVRRRPARRSTTRYTTATARLRSTSASSSVSKADRISAAAM